MLKYLAEQKDKEKEVSIYVDLRSIGSNNSIYSDSSKTKVERASILLVDVLSYLHDEFLNLAIGEIDTHPHPGVLTRP